MAQPEHGRSPGRDQFAIGSEVTGLRPCHECLLVHSRIRTVWAARFVRVTSQECAQGARGFGEPLAAVAHIDRLRALWIPMNLPEDITRGVNVDRRP